MCLHERFLLFIFKLLLNQNHVVLLCQPFHSSKFYFYYLSECVGIQFDCVLKGS